MQGEPPEAEQQWSILLDAVVQVLVGSVAMDRTRSANLPPVT